MKPEFALTGQPPVKAQIVTTIHAVCPACSEGQFGIDHTPGRYGPWGCSACGARWMFDIEGSDVTMTRAAIDDQPGWLVVRIGEAEPPVYAVVDHPFYAHSAGETPDERTDHTRYWVEEHTCPTNIIRVEAFVTEGDDDPHGLLSFVAHLPRLPGEDSEPEEGWAAWIETAVAGEASRRD